MCTNNLKLSLVVPGSNPISNKSSFDLYLEKIESYTPSYRSDRIFAADKSAIMLGMAEFDNFKQTPVPVIINEAVNLSAKYSTEKSTDFVNGVLAEYVKNGEDK